MHRPFTRLRAVAVALVGAAALMAPIAAVAQPFADEHIRGTIRSYDESNDEKHLVLQDDRGYLDDVQLGHETRISPSGTQLTAGTRVEITGYNGGKWFDAVSIAVIGRDRDQAAASGPSYSRPDSAANGYAAAPPPAYPPANPVYVPYPAYYPYPVYVYSYPAPYPYPVYGYGYRAYPYRAYPSVRVGIRFGNAFGWRGGWHR